MTDEERRPSGTTQQGTDERGGNATGTTGSVTERPDGNLQYEPPEMTRRTVAMWLGAISGIAAIGSFAVSAVTGLSDAGFGTGGTELYVKGTHLVTKAGKRLNANSALPAGKGNEVLVLPELKGGKPSKNSDAPTLLVRFSEKEFEKPTNVDGTVEGYVAYSMVCTHEGCLVADRQGKNLRCPCHGSVYDPLKGATVVGGPAPRPIPQLPIGISKQNQLLIATGPFEGPIGPQ